MRLKGYSRVVLAFALCCAGLFAQTVTSSLVGTVVDPAGGAVKDAPVTLTSTDTGETRSAITDSGGTYRFGNILAGTYSVTVKAPGFKSEIESGIVVLAQEAHVGGRIALEPGSVTELNSVAAEATPIQLADGEKSWTIDAGELETLTQKGRDMFGFMRLAPGVVDTNLSRDVPSSTSLTGIAIDGNTSAINFNVDGITDLDTGYQGIVHVEPNIDSIQEIRILQSNYEAEYGRNSGGIITVISKSGSRDFHGTGSWNHRNEEFNANSWSNNHTLTASGTATPRDDYRFNVETYGIGGPVYIPKTFNEEKKKLFFYFSEERTGQFVPAPDQTTYMPTTNERGGDFSQTFTNVNGNAVALPILDPQNGNKQFAGNMIPASRISTVGQELLDFFPSSNFTPTQTNQLYIDNYFETGSDKHTRRNDMVRVDAYLTDKISAYVRWIDDKDNMTQLFQGVPFSQTAGSGPLTTNISPLSHPNPGHGYQGTVTDAISPTFINEVTAGYSWNSWAWYTTDNYASEARSLEPSLPLLFPEPTMGVHNEIVSPVNFYHSLLPTFTFGGNGLPASAYYLRNGALAGTEEDFNTIYTLQDNVSKVLGHHALKAGFYGERNTRLQPANQNYNGAYTFASDPSSPFLNTNDGYANALLGDVNTYTQYTGATTSDVLYYNVEFYAQDHWRVNSRLSVDFGVRFYHQTPPTDHEGTFVNFVPANYSKSAESRLYYPYCVGATTCSSPANGLVARDPLAGATVGSGYIGDLVYGSGNPASGLVNLGKSTPPYHQDALAYGPRFGFAWDVFGDGRTAVRGGGGLYHNRLPGNSVYGLSGQEPLTYQQSVNNVTFTQIAAIDNGVAPVITNLTVAPATPYSWPSSVPFEGVENASLSVQHLLRGNMFVDLGYVLNHSFNQFLTYDINYVPIGTSWPFKPSNLNPTTAGATSADIGSIFERSLYPGYGAINGAAFLGSSTYNAVTANVRSRTSYGLAWNAAYTWSKALGVTTYSPEVSNNTSYNYGRLATDRKQNLQVSFTYDIPNFATKAGFTKVGYVTDHWQLSGIASVQSGAPYDPTCSVTSGQPAPASYTGTPDLTARCNVTGNPLNGAGKTGNGQNYFNPGAFALPALATGPNNSIAGPAVLGNLGGGAGVLSLPRYTNFDVTATKNIPIFGNEKRLIKLQVQAYNVLNHTEISGINTAIQFNPANNTVSNPSGVGYISSALPNRILVFSARLVF